MNCGSDINIAVDRHINTAYDNVKIVADNIEDLKDIAKDLENLDTVVESLDDISKVSNHIDNVDVVGDSIDVINTSADSIEDIKTVATDIGKVSTVANNINEVSTVANNIEPVKNVSDGMEFVKKSAVTGVSFTANNSIKLTFESKESIESESITLNPSERAGFIAAVNRIAYTELLGFDISGQPNERGVGFIGGSHYTEEIDGVLSNIVKPFSQGVYVPVVEGSRGISLLYDETTFSQFLVIRHIDKDGNLVLDPQNWDPSDNMELDYIPSESQIENIELRDIVHNNVPMQILTLTYKEKNKSSTSIQLRSISAISTSLDIVQTVETYSATTLDSANKYTDKVTKENYFPVVGGTVSGSMQLFKPTDPTFRVSSSEGSNRSLFVLDSNGTDIVSKAFCIERNSSDGFVEFYSLNSNKKVAFSISADAITDFKFQPTINGNLIPTKSYVDDLVNDLENQTEQSINTLDTKAKGYASDAQGLSQEYADSNFLSLKGGAVAGPITARKESGVQVTLETSDKEKATFELLPEQKFNLSTKANGDVYADVFSVNIKNQEINFTKTPKILGDNLASEDYVNKLSAEYDGKSQDYANNALLNSLKYTDDNFLPLVGGTVTGPVEFQEQPSLDGSPLLTEYDVKNIDLRLQTRQYLRAKLNVNYPRFGQGYAYSTEQDRHYVYVRVAGDTDQQTERFKILEFYGGSDGETLDVVSETSELISGHQGLSIEKRDGDHPRLWTRAAPHKDDQDVENSGKGLYRWDYRGSSTTNDNAQRYQLFHDKDSNKSCSEFHNATACISSDQKLLIVKVSSSNQFSTDQRIFVYSFPKVLGLNEPQRLNPDNFNRESDAYETDFPLSREQLRAGNFNQEVSCDGRFIYVHCGGSDVGGANKNTITYTLNGDFVFRSDHSMGKPAQDNNPTKWEPEGGDIDTHRKELLTLINTLGDLGTTYEVWGLREVGGSISTARAHKVETGAQIEIYGDTKSSISIPQGETIKIVSVDSNTGEQKKILDLGSTGNLKIYGNENDNGSRIGRQNTDGRQITEIRGNTGLSNGGGINIYGDEDTVNPSGVTIFLGGEENSPDGYFRMNLPREDPNVKGRWFIKNVGGVDTVCVSK